MADYATFGKRVEELGVFIAAGKLQPTATARTLRVRDGKRLTTERRRSLRRHRWVPIHWGRGGATHDRSGGGSGRRG